MTEHKHTSKEDCPACNLSDKIFNLISAAPDEIATAVLNRLVFMSIGAGVTAIGEAATREYFNEMITDYIKNFKDDVEKLQPGVENGKT